MVSPPGPTESTTTHTLTPNPSGCRTLTDPERDRLIQQYPGLWANPETSCPTCHKKGTFKQRRGDDIVEVACDCRAQWKLHRWLLNAGIGSRYQRITWEDAEGVPDEVQLQVLQYVHDAEANLSEGTGMTLWSPDKGTGKTMMATLVLKSLLARGHDGYFTQFNDMLDFSTSGWRDAEERAWFTRKVRNTGALVVDDLGREYRGRAEVAEAMFDTVVRARVAASQPTIITTNYTPEQVLQGYGPNILSLLSEVNVEVHLPGIDYRPTAKARMLRDRRDGIDSRPFTVG